MTLYTQTVNNHYARPNLKDVILDGLRAAGKDPQNLDYKDLVPLDQFHTRGREATLELAELAKLPANSKVLDVGGGFGGPARTLAAEFGWDVTVLDITEEYCRIGEMFTEATRLTDKVHFKTASALDMPFADTSFDGAWTQHSSMNIEDKEQLYAEIHRVVRPGGRLALHEVMAGSVQPVHAPVPWASTPDINFLRPAESMRELIQAAGFREVLWEDVTKPAYDFFAPRFSGPAPASLAPFGIHLVFGERFFPSFKNLLRNLEENRLTVIQAVFERV